MYDWGIRLNVGQVLVLQLHSDEILAYVQLRRGKSIYSAVDVPSDTVRIAPAEIATVSSKTWTAHEQFIRAAAKAKKISPWKRGFSEGALRQTEILCDVNLPRPAYIEDSQHAEDGSKLYYLCAYTIRDANILERAWRQGSSFSFTEGKHWKRIEREFASAQKSGSELPIVFADARATEHCGTRHCQAHRLHFWSGCHGDQLQAHGQIFGCAGWAH